RPPRAHRDAPPSRPASWLSFFPRRRAARRGRPASRNSHSEPWPARCTPPPAAARENCPAPAPNRSADPSVRREGARRRRSRQAAVRIAWSFLGPAFFGRSRNRAARQRAYFFFLPRADAAAFSDLLLCARSARWARSYVWISLKRPFASRTA